MKLTYEKPTMDSRTYAQFENVFTFCSKGNTKRGCTVEGIINPGAGSDPVCILHNKAPNDQQYHAALGEGSGN